MIGGRIVIGKATINEKVCVPLLHDLARMQKSKLSINS